ncbi:MULTISPECIES: amidohydrolase family protein [Flavobacteriaceae]|uniref:amidohydrolase family protein n=1 Tax=Flavobacteriaceae TaxID=49546 RepID=UPI00149269DA|nr:MULTISPECIES: amidohydrolase family protein [Allomuricauda]MDC6366820.1 amidohydrolase family protein [Muricauda sp. AC10]
MKFRIVANLNYGLLVLVALLLHACGEKTEQFYTLEDYDKIPKIDTHIHVTASRNLFEEISKEHNFRLLNIVVAGSRTREAVKQEYDIRAAKKEQYPALYEVATAFSVKEWDSLHWAAKTIDRLQEDIDNGAVAVKVWKNIGMQLRDSTGRLIMVDDPKLDTIFNYLTQKGIPVIGHLGEPKNCWLPLDKMTVANDSVYYSEHPKYHMFNFPELPPYEEQIAARDRRLERNPELVFIGAHMASLEWSVDELAERFDRFPNLSVDIAARIGQIFFQTIEDREKVREFFIKYQDRIMYGSDLGDSGKTSEADLRMLIQETWLLDWEFFATDHELQNFRVKESFKGLKLPREVMDKIYYKNAQNWFKAFDGKEMALSK